MRASIIVLTYNQLEDGTRPCIESIYRYTNQADFELIIVDNASSDGTPEFLISLEKIYNNITIILNRSNKGYAGGNNDGMRVAKGEFVILLNNDTLMTPRWLDDLLKPFGSDPSIGLVGPVTNSAGNEQMIVIPSLTEENYVQVCSQYVIRQKGYQFETDKLGFYCVAIRANVIEKVGLLDENFGIGMFEDDDYCLRAQSAGFRLMIVESCFIYHKGSLSFKKMVNDEYQELFVKNRKYFIAKNGTEWLFNNLTMAFYKQMEREVRSLQARSTENIPEVERISVRLNGFRYLIENAKNLEKRSGISGNTIKAEESRYKRAYALFVSDFIKGDGRKRRLFTRRAYRSIIPLKNAKIIEMMGKVRKENRFERVLFIPATVDYGEIDSHAKEVARVFSRGGQLVVFGTWNSKSDVVEVIKKVEDHVYLMNQGLIGFLPHMANAEEVVLWATGPSSILAIDSSYFSTVLLDLSNYDLSDIQNNMTHIRSAIKDKVTVILVASNEIALDISRAFDQRVVVLEHGIDDHNIDKVMAALSISSK